MNRMIPAGCLAVLLLGGCHATPHKPDYGAASDVARTRHAQYQLWEHGALSGQTHAVTSQPALTANSDDSPLTGTAMPLNCWTVWPVPGVCSLVTTASGSPCH